MLYLWEVRIQTHGANRDPPHALVKDWTVVAETYQQAVDVALAEQRRQYITELPAVMSLCRGAVIEGVHWSVNLSEKPA